MVSNNLRSEREAQDLRIRELARIVKTAPSTILRIETGEIADPRPALQVRIARALRRPLDAIFPIEETIQ